jgi:small subunit ribosomal protein S6
LARSVYEGMFILDANRYGREPEAVSGQIPEMIRGAGGQMLVSRLWEERRLAYPIHGHRKGAYWLTYFKLDPGQLGGVKRKCQLSDSILRALFVKVDPRIVDMLVAHAQAGPGAASPREGKGDRAGGQEARGKDEAAQAKKDEAGKAKDKAGSAARKEARRDEAEAAVKKG